MTLGFMGWGFAIWLADDAMVPAGADGGGLRPVERVVICQVASDNQLVVKAAFTLPAVWLWV